MNNQFLEQTLMSACIMQPEVLSKVAWLDPEDFTFVEHQQVWEVIKQILKDGLSVDISLVHKMLREMGVEMNQYLQILYADTFISNGYNYVSFAKQLREERVKDGLANKQDIGEIKDMINEMDRAYITNSELYDFPKAMTKFMDGLERRNDNILYTGFKRLDYIFGGFNQGDLIVLSARPAMGKSSLALWISFKLAKEKKKVIYFNLEMNVENLMAKLISAETQIDNAKFRDKNFSDYNAKLIMKRVEELIEENPTLNIVDAGSATVSDIENELKCGAGFIVIDQLTKIKPVAARDRKDLEIADITFALKEMAKNYKVPILLLHQTNRLVDRRTNQMPTLSDLRDSGAVEQDADVVMFIHRKAYYTNDEKDDRMVIKIAKNKMGMTGVIGFRFLKEISTIVEVDREEQKKDFCDYEEGGGNNG